MADASIRKTADKLSKAIGIALCLFVLVFVNTSWLEQQPKLALFGMMGLLLVFARGEKHNSSLGARIDSVCRLVLSLATVFGFGYVFVQSERVFERFWIDGTMLGDRAGAELGFEFVFGVIGVIIVIEATRRCIGWTLPILCLIFLAYGFFGRSMPDWLFPHRGITWQQMAQKTFLQSGTMCVFGIALNVMFKYVFLFVLFGTLLDQTGATAYIIRFARRLFRNSAGGPAKVAVLSSGMMGSLSGSAVANTATTGTFTIPLMKSTGFDAERAAGIEAAASSGGALMPPIMGAGAYMMLEIVPDVTILDVIKAAIIPAILYYVALLLTVHFYSKRIGAQAEQLDEDSTGRFSSFHGVLFFSSFALLIGLLLYGFSPYRSVSVSLIGILLLSALNPHTRLNLTKIANAMIAAARSGTALIVAASCVGIILGIVDMTGLGPALPAKVQSLAGDNGFLALLLLMVSTVILGMGLPSAVCYLLVALTVGNVLQSLDTPPLAAHLFIFYFGMMSMVTPPVALAAYAAAAIAKGDVIRSAFAAFQFALVGFALPFAFVIRPELLMLTAENSAASPLAIFGHVIVTLVANTGLAAAIAGFAFAPLKAIKRLALLAFSLSIFFTRWDGMGIYTHVAAVTVVLLILTTNFFQRKTKQK